MQAFNASKRVAPFNAVWMLKAYSSNLPIVNWLDVFVELVVNVEGLNGDQQAVGDGEGVEGGEGAGVWRGELQMLKEATVGW